MAVKEWREVVRTESEREGVTPVFSYGRKHQGQGTVSPGMKGREQGQGLPCRDFLLTKQAGWGSVPPAENH